MNNKFRFHALDNLRGIIMWLGIVLHVLAQHLAIESPLQWGDTKTTLVADFLFFFIHAFRMPVFFILSGFFVALLVERHGYKGMLIHRLKRIGIPFLIFWPLLFVGIAVVALLYFNVMIKGQLGLDISAVPPPKDNAPYIINAMHLWFLYYLLIFCLIVYIMGLIHRLIPEKIQHLINKMWLLVSRKWWGLILLAIPLACISPILTDIMDVSTVEFMPKLKPLLHHGTFFIFGWYFFKNKTVLFSIFLERYKIYCLWGVIFFSAAIIFYRYEPEYVSGSSALKWLAAFFYNAATWFLSLSLIGAFMKFLFNQNKVLKYISESSYWVYLIHLIGTIGFGALLYNTPLDAFSKIGINIFLTTLICLMTYHIFVRHTFIGILLNGSKVK